MYWGEIFLHLSQYQIKRLRQTACDTLHPPMRARLVFYIYTTNRRFDIKRTGLEKSLFLSCKKERRVQKEREKKHERILSFLWRCNFTKHIKPWLNSDPWVVLSSAANPPTGQLLRHPFSFFPPRSKPHSLTFSSVWTFSEPLDSLTKKKDTRLHNCPAAWAPSSHTSTR